MTLPGPSRRIIVQPLQAPAAPDAPDPLADPGPASPAPERESQPAHPEADPVAPDREPAQPGREPVPVP